MRISRVYQIAQVVGAHTEIRYICSVELPSFWARKTSGLNLANLMPYTISSFKIFLIYQDVYGSLFAGNKRKGR